jgi:hypothetical protein
LLDQERIEAKLAAGQRHAVIVVHPAGHGSPADFMALQDDLRVEDFTFQTLSLAMRVDG